MSDLLLAAAGRKTHPPSGPVRIELWPSHPTPATQNAGADSAVNLGTEFESDTNLEILGATFWKSNGRTDDLIQVGLFRTNSNDLLASGSEVMADDGGWVDIPFAAPFTVTADLRYYIVAHWPAGFYGLTVDYFSTGAGGSGVSSPPLVAPNQAGSTQNAQGTFVYNAALTRPTNGSDNCYWVSPYAVV